MAKTSATKNIAYRTIGVSKIYGTGKTAVHALRGIDLEIPDGEFIVLLGASGSGKTTLLNILGGIDHVTDGSVYFLNSELTSMTERELTRYRRDNVGFVFQAYNLMPSLTALENVELVTEIAKNPMDAAEALSLVGLGDRVNHFPSELSGGEQQRVAIARAIAKNPEVLFCDEPTGALDSVTGRSVLNALQQVNKKLGALVVIITHATATAAMADRVIHFHDGKIQKVTQNKTKLSADEIEW